MNAEFGFNTEYLKECFKRRKEPEERKYPKKDWPIGYEPTKKEFEKYFEEGTGIPVSFHWEDIGGGKKRGVFTPINREAEKNLKDQKNKDLSNKDFNKIDERKKDEGGLKELSAQEAWKDPWFNKQINNLFGLENSKLPPEKENSVIKVSESNTNYNNWTKNQLISEINRLKVENKQLKANLTLTATEKATKIQQNQQQLEKIEKLCSLSQLNTNSNAKSNSLFTNLAIGGTVLALIGLVSILVFSKSRKR